MENMILVPQKDPGAARALLDAFCGLAESGEIELRAAAVVERQADGRWSVPVSKSATGKRSRNFSTPCLA